VLLHVLKEQLGIIYRFANAASEESGPNVQVMAMPDGLQNYTLSELAEYNGKNGNPAYVAVNGVVYDVTDNAAWAAASHFGLNAGRELTGAHASCHANQDVLSKLKVVGRLDDGVAQL
jgi:predicted heme/steroid binding protein